MEMVKFKANVFVDVSTIFWITWRRTDTPIL